MLPSAVTTSAASRLSTLSPCSRGKADAAAEGEPGDAGVAHDAAGGGQTVGLRLVVDVALEHRLARAVRSTGSTVTARIAERSITTPSSHTAVPATLWPPPRTAISRSWSRAKRGRDHIGTPVQRAMQAGWRSIAPFQILRAVS